MTSIIAAQFSPLQIKKPTSPILASDIVLIQRILASCTDPNVAHSFMNTRMPMVMSSHLVRKSAPNPRVSIINVVPKESLYSRKKNSIQTGKEHEFDGFTASQGTHA